MHSLAISIRDLNKVYFAKHGQSFVALDGINLDIPLGSCCALLGPNGAGKSTLINILAGSVIKTSGTVNVVGHDLDLDPMSVKQSLGVVPQELSLDVYLSVYESLELYAGYYGIRSKNRKTKEILEVLALKDKSNDTARSLSGGMKRRLLVAKALVHSPPVVILDEPTAGVDLELRDKLWSYISHLNRSGTTVLLTTHYLQEAEKLCDYFVFVNKGKILACRKKGELHESFGRKKVILRFSERLEFVPESFAKYSPFIENDGYSLVLSGVEPNLNYLLSQIHSDIGVGIADLAVSAIDLETVFRQLMLADLI